MEGKLQKPVFVKVNALENNRDGYNVYVKIISAEVSKNENQTFEMVRAVVADQTGCANAFFKGDNVKLIKKDAVIAIRNGRIRLIKGHISLEVDLFGRVTEEKVEIKNPDTTNNISEKQITRRPRNNRRQQRPRRQGGDREQGGDRRPRREYDGDRRPRREEGAERRTDYNDQRQNRDERPRRTQTDKPRREQGDRPPRREQGDRKPRREQGDRPRREEGDQKRNYDDRRPRREEGGDRDNRPKTQWTKIGAIEPGEEGLNLFAKILAVEEVKNRVRVVIGDETGKVKGFFYNDPETFKVGNTVVIFKAEATVNKEHIELQSMRGGKVELSKGRKINQIDESVDISAKAWVESA